MSHGLSDKERLGAVAFGRKASERFAQPYHGRKGVSGVARARGRRDDGFLFGNDGLEADFWFFHKEERSQEKPRMTSHPSLVTLSIHFAKLRPSVMATLKD